jgi:glutamate-1-semialdehyde aminotransferase
MRAAAHFAPHPQYAAQGEGCWIYDIDGRRILDYANNFFSLGGLTVIKDRLGFRHVVLR